MAMKLIGPELDYTRRGRFAGSAEPEGTYLTDTINVDNDALRHKVWSMFGRPNLKSLLRRSLLQEEIVFMISNTAKNKHFGNNPLFSLALILLLSSCSEESSLDSEGSILSKIRDSTPRLSSSEKTGLNLR
jgi:hypothetical protein